MVIASLKVAMQHAYEILKGPGDSGSDSTSTSDVKARLAALKQKRPKTKRLGSGETERVERLVPYGPNEKKPGSQREAQKGRFCVANGGWYDNLSLMMSIYCL